MCVTNIFHPLLCSLMSTLSLLFETDLLSQPSRVVPQGLHEIIQFDTNFFKKKIYTYSCSHQYLTRKLSAHSLLSTMPVQSTRRVSRLILNLKKNIGKTLAWNFSGKIPVAHEVHR